MVAQIPRVSNSLAYNRYRTKDCESSGSLSISVKMNMRGLEGNVVSVVRSTMMKILLRLMQLSRISLPV